MILHDWAGNELWEERYVKEHPRVAALRFHVCAIHVDDVRERLEGVERYAEGKRYVWKRYGEAKQRVYCGSEHVRILEDHQEPKIHHHGDHEPRFSSRTILVAHELSHDVVEQRACQHEEHEHGLAICVEQKACHNEHGILCRN